MRLARIGAIAIAAATRRPHSAIQDGWHPGRWASERRCSGRSGRRGPCDPLPDRPTLETWTRRYFANDLLTNAVTYGGNGQQGPDSGGDERPARQDRPAPTVTRRHGRARIQVLARGGIQTLKSSPWPTNRDGVFSQSNEGVCTSKIVRRSHDASLLLSLQPFGRDETYQHGDPRSGCSKTPIDIRRHWQTSRGVIYTIFEGTSEIQRLVIARAISGLRVE
jgi:hypothetical protein